MSQVFKGSANISFRDHMNWALASRYSVKAGLYAGLISSALITCLKVFKGKEIDSALIITALTLLLTVLVVTVVICFLLLTIMHLRLSPNQRLVEWEIDADKLQLNDALGNVIITPWTEVKRFEVKSKGILFHQNPNCYRWIPNRVFSAFDKDEIVKLASSKLNTRL